MSLGNVPYNVRQTFWHGQQNVAQGEAIARMFRKSGDTASAAPSTPAEPTEQSGSGFWLIGLIVLILSAIISLFTGGDSAENANHGEPASGNSHDGSNTH
jgi:hypothetical protein